MRVAKGPFHRPLQHKLYSILGNSLAYVSSSHANMTGRVLYLDKP